jgi:transcriptional regulator with XRE-family HTH domain
MSSPTPPLSEIAETRPYPRPHPSDRGWEEVPRKKSSERPGFGARLRELRQAAGYTQQELAQEIDVSRRRIAYYEGETEHPPAALLTALAEALGVTTDELLGATPLRRKKAAKTDSRLQRRMSQIERMNPREKRQVLQILDALIEREQLRASKG